MPLSAVHAAMHKAGLYPDKGKQTSSRRLGKLIDGGLPGGMSYSRSSDATPGPFELAIATCALLSTVRTFQHVFGSISSQRLSWATHTCDSWPCPAAGRCVAAGDLGKHHGGRRNVPTADTVPLMRPCPFSLICQPMCRVSCVRSRCHASREGAVTA